MTWNYRVLRDKSGNLALHEVYYNDAGQPDGYTQNPAGFYSDAEEGLQGLIGSLEMALRDARERPILDITDIKGCENT